MKWVNTRFHFLIINCKNRQLLRHCISDWKWIFLRVNLIKPLRLPKSDLGEQQSHFSFDLLLFDQNRLLMIWERFPPLVEGIRWSSVDSPHKGTVILSFDFFVRLCSGLPWLHHDDVIKWKHFPRYWPFERRIHWSPVNSPHKGQWRGALIFSLICERLSKQSWGWWIETPSRSS